MRTLGEAPALCKWPEDLFDDKIVVAGAGEASRMPADRMPTAGLQIHV